MENLSIYGINTPPPGTMFNEALKVLKGKIIKWVFKKQLRYIYCFIQKKYGDGALDTLTEYIHSIYCLKQAPVAYTTCQSVNRALYAESVRGLKCNNVDLK